MKKYFLPVVAFVLITGAVNAQTAVKKTSTDKPVAKMNKPATKPAASTATTATVSPSATTTPAKSTGAAAIKRKQHKKSKSVKPVSK